MSEVTPEILKQKINEALSLMKKFKKFDSAYIFKSLIKMKYDDYYYTPEDIKFIKSQFDICMTYSVTYRTELLTYICNEIKKKYCDDILSNTPPKNEIPYLSFKFPS